VGAIAAVAADVIVVTIKEESFFRISCDVSFSLM